jgi:hypothetical protein
LRDVFDFCGRNAAVAWSTVVLQNETFAHPVNKYVWLHEATDCHRPASDQFRLQVRIQFISDTFYFYPPNDV